VARDELDILDAAAVRDLNLGENLTTLKIPQMNGTSFLDAESGLQDRDGDNIVRGQNNVVVKVDTESMRAELIRQNLELLVVRSAP
jgi:hypothetical protein